MIKHPLDNVLLSVSGLNAGYLPGVDFLVGVSLEIKTGEIVALLGRNGAGKSTLIRSLGGHLRPTAGHVLVGGVDMTGVLPAAIVKAGVATVPEGRRVFGSLSVQENLTLGMFSRRGGLLAKADLARVYDIYPRLAERRAQLAGTLSGGEQQMVAMGRALMANPRLLLLDEPSMGLAPMLIEGVFDMVDQLARNGMTILLVEQNAAAALDVADRAYVLERGRIVGAGDAEALQNSADIQAHYLGVEGT